MICAVILCLSSRKHNRLAVIQEHPVLDMQPHRPGQHHLLNVAAKRYQIVRRHGMAHALDTLLDDRPLVKGRDDIMGGRPDQLDAPSVRLVIGLGALETRQEGMMDVGKGFGPAYDPASPIAPGRLLCDRPA